MRLYEIKHHVPAEEYNSIYVWCEDTNDALSVMQQIIPALTKDRTLIFEIYEGNENNAWVYAYFYGKPRGIMDTRGLPVHALEFETLECPFIWAPTREEKIDLFLGKE